MSSRHRHNALVRYRDPDDPELLDAKRQMAADSIAIYIKRTAATAPPLTAEQRDRLATLLRGGDAA